MAKLEKRKRQMEKEKRTIKKQCWSFMKTMKRLAEQAFLLRDLQRIIPLFSIWVLIKRKRPIYRWTFEVWFYSSSSNWMLFPQVSLKIATFTVPISSHLFSPLRGVSIFFVNPRFVRKFDFHHLSEKKLRNEHALVRILSGKIWFNQKTFFTCEKDLFKTSQTSHVECVVLLELKE